LPLIWGYLPPLLLLLLVPLLLLLVVLKWRVEGRCYRYSSSNSQALSSSSSSRWGPQGVTAVQLLLQQQPQQPYWTLEGSLSPAFRSGC
jgi:hypothetical protein